MNQPEPQSRPFETIISQIKNGIIKIPQFQRDFVWTRLRSAGLLDSILKGYPIGTFILWRTREQLRTVRNLGDAELPDTPKGDYAQQVLDGQQRLTSLFAAINGLQVNRNGKDEDFGAMYVNLSSAADNNQPVVTTDISGLEACDYIPLRKLHEGDFKVLANYPERHHDKLQQYKNRLKSYNFSIILVDDAPLDVATDIFTRINVGGQKLTVFEIMVAKTFDRERDFDLAAQYQVLIDKLENVNYSTLSSAVVLQTVAALMTKTIGRKEILNLDKQKFIDTWPKAVDAIETAVDYFHKVYRVPVSNLLPYQAMIVPFAYFFHHHPNKPLGETKDRLQDFFWRTALTGRYSGASETAIEQDLRHVDDILAGKHPAYETGVDLSESFIRQNGYFRASRAYVKAILCIYVAHGPRSFSDDGQVKVSNDWLKRANSRNYHHFFPRAFLQRQGYALRDANHVANITIVDDFMNKNVIRDKAPSDYMNRIRKQNPNLAKTMRTHLIRVDSFGIWEDDYERFITQRIKWIARELNKRIIPHKVDERGQEVLADEADVDAEAEETTETV